jgi:3-methylfumaryl-CoA hydratase
MSEWDEWLARSRSHHCQMDAWRSQALAASLELKPHSDDGLPMLWHWIYFLESPQRAMQGEDGHPQKGDFFPPITNPRRMFAGGRSTMHRPLQLDQSAELIETILRCEEKSGGSGNMTVLTVSYNYHQHGQLCVEEERDFIYLPARVGEQPEAVCTDYAEIASSDWAGEVATDPVLLFKYSALTFNSHRIHYDRDYARREESYPDLVVHGPMTAILLADLARRESASELRRFSFRARAPLYVGDRLRLRGEPATADGAIKLVAYRPDGKAAMTAEVEMTG